MLLISDVEVQTNFSSVSDPKLFENGSRKEAFLLQYFKNLEKLKISEAPLLVAVLVFLIKLSYQRGYLRTGGHPAA